MNENRKKFEKAYINAITRILECEEIRLEQLIFYSEKMLLVLDFGLFKMQLDFEYKEKDVCEKALFEMTTFIIERLEKYKTRMEMFCGVEGLVNPINLIIEKVSEKLTEIIGEDIESRLDDFVKMLSSKSEREIYELYCRWGNGIRHESCLESKSLKRTYKFLLVNGCEVWLKGECMDESDEVDEW